MKSNSYNQGLIPPIANKRLLLPSILLLAIMTTIFYDIYLGSIPAIANHFSTSINASQLSMAAFAWGLTPCLLIYGPLSENIGRRHALTIGFSIVFIGTGLCYWSPTIGTLYLGRLLQGIGIAAPTSLWRAIYRDIFSNEELDKYTPFLSIILDIVIPLAPIIGSIIHHVFNWQSTFVFLFIMGFIAIVMANTHIPETRTVTKNTSFPELTSNYRQALETHQFLPFAICSLFANYALISWFVAAPALLINDLQLDINQFGIITTGITLTGMLVGNITNIVLTKYHRPRTIMILALKLMLISLTLMLLGYYYCGLTIMSICLPIFIFATSLPLIWPNAFNQSMKYVTHKSGYTAACYCFIQQLGGASASLIASYLTINNQLPLLANLSIATLGIGFGVTWGYFQDQQELTDHNI